MLANGSKKYDRKKKKRKFMKKQNAKGSQYTFNSQIHLEQVC